MVTLSGPEFRMRDRKIVVTEVVSVMDSSRCLVLLIQDMLVRGGKMIVGFDLEWCFKENAHRIALFKLCTELGCVLIRLDPEPGIFSPSYASLKYFRTMKDIIFVGIHVKEDLEKLKEDYGLVIRNAVDLSEVVVNSRKQPKLGAYGTRDLAYTVLGVQFGPRPLSVIMSNWFLSNLSSDQIECATIDAYATYQTGKRILENNWL